MRFTLSSAFYRFLSVLIQSVRVQIRYPRAKQAFCLGGNSNRFTKHETYFLRLGLMNHPCDVQQSGLSNDNCTKLRGTGQKFDTQRFGPILPLAICSSDPEFQNAVIITCLEPKIDPTIYIYNIDRTPTSSILMNTYNIVRNLV